MLAQGATPSCSASFLHLADGILFRLETELRFPSPNSRETEYFWLCEPCSAEATLRLTLDRQVLATRLAAALCNGPYVALNAVAPRTWGNPPQRGFLPRTIPRAPRNPPRNIPS